MSERKRFLLLLSILTVVAVGAGSITLIVLYNTAFEQQRGRLVETIKSQARLIEDVASFNENYSRTDIPGEAFEAALSQLKEAHTHFEGFAETGEFTLAKLEGDSIIFLLSHRHHDLDNPYLDSYKENYTEPMRLALSGKSGTVIGLDYRGEMVLAAHRPMAGLNMGIVAKIDLSEVRAPFVRAAILASCGAALLIIIGATLFLRVGMPLIHHLEESEKKYRQLFSSELDAIYVFTAETLQFIDANPAALELYGYDLEEFLNLNIQDISAESEKTMTSVHRVLKGDTKKITFRLHKKKDGTVFPVEVSPGSFTLGKRKILCGIVRDITERKIAEAALNASLKEKEMLLKEIHHRVKNNLQVISSLLRIQSDYTDDHEIFSVLEASQSRVNSMALIHEQLYQSTSLAAIDFREYIRNLAEHLMASYGMNIKGIILENSLRNVFLSIDTAIPCGLIVTELLTNALVHAFPDGRTGRIRISHSSEGNQSTLTVSDTGIGVPHELDPEHTQSLGLQLVSLLAKQLGGSIEVKVDKGSSFSLVYPQETASADDSLHRATVLENAQRRSRYDNGQCFNTDS